MAEDWRTAYGRVKMELEEYKETIVPALMEKIQELEERLAIASETAELLTEATREGK